MSGIQQSAAGWFDPVSGACETGCCGVGKQTIQTSYWWKPVSRDPQSTPLLFGWISGQARNDEIHRICCPDQ